METQNTDNAQNAVAPSQANPYIENTANAQDNASILSSLSSADFLKGALIGAAVGYVLTNEKAQKNIMKAFAKGTQFVQMGVEEMKERFEDVKAEMQAD